MSQSTSKYSEQCIDSMTENGSSSRHSRQNSRSKQLFVVPYGYMSVRDSHESFRLHSRASAQTLRLLLQRLPYLRFGIARQHFNATESSYTETNRLRTVPNLFRPIPTLNTQVPSIPSDIDIGWLHKPSLSTLPPMDTEFYQSLIVRNTFVDFKDADS